MDRAVCRRHSTRRGAGGPGSEHLARSVKPASGHSRRPPAAALARRRPGCHWRNIGSEERPIWPEWRATGSNQSGLRLGAVSGPVGRRPGRSGRTWLLEQRVRRNPALEETLLPCVPGCHVFPRPRSGSARSQSLSRKLASVLSLAALCAGRESASLCGRPLSRPPTSSDDVTISDMVRRAIQGYNRTASGWSQRSAATHSNWP